MLDLSNFTKANLITDNSNNASTTEMTLYHFLKSNNINLEKTNNDDWKDSLANRIIQPKLAPVYFGIIDTLYVKSKDGIIKFNSNNDNDIVSIKLNSKKITDQIDSKKKRMDEEFILDTGLNYISFFSDDFGKNPPSSASFSLEFDNYKKKIDFVNQ